MWHSYNLPNAYGVYETIQGPHKVKVGLSNVVTAKDIIIANILVPFVHKGIEVDINKTRSN